MDEPTGSDLAQRFRALLPEQFLAGFDADLDLFSDGQDQVTQCGALAAFSWSFDRCVAAGEQDVIRGAFAIVEELLELSAPLDGAAPASRVLYDSVLTCFLENVLPTTEAGHPLVVPNMGPRAVAFAERFEPWWLLPYPDATLHS